MNCPSIPFLIDDLLVLVIHLVCIVPISTCPERIKEFVVKGHQSKILPLPVSYSSSLDIFHLMTWYLTLDFDHHKNQCALTGGC